jgi:hypothetical protein
MRLWSIHPKYLDAKGLVALWREALLAQKVLQGLTRGYRYHPQLSRFKKTPDPLLAVGTYLSYIWQEGNNRGYRFDRTKIASQGKAPPIPVNAGQLKYEFDLLMAKLETRDPLWLKTISPLTVIEPHPFFIAGEGGIEAWEKQKLLKIVN